MKYLTNVLKVKDPATGKIFPLLAFRGPKGEQGDKGDKGEKGDTGKGEKGDAGVGIQSVTADGTDGSGGNKYKLTLTDGSEHTVVCPKGDKGEKGNSGVSPVYTNGEWTFRKFDDGTLEAWCTHSFGEISFITVVSGALHIASSIKLACPTDFTSVSAVFAAESVHPWLWISNCYIGSDNNINLHACRVSTNSVNSEVTANIYIIGKWK